MYMWAGLSVQSPSLTQVYYNKCSICEQYNYPLIDRNFNRKQREYKFKNICLTCNTLLENGFLK